MDQKLYADYRQFIYSFANRLNEINKKEIFYINEDGTKLRTEIKLELHEKIKELRTYNQRVLDDLKFDFKENNFEKFNIACDYYIEILNKAKDTLFFNIHKTKINQRSQYVFVVINKLEGEYVERFDLKIWDFELFALELVNQIQENIEKLSKEISNKYQKSLKVKEAQKIDKRVKLNWNGQKNQLYNVLRQLKEGGLISNSYNELANFLIENVVGFESNSKETIEKQLKKTQPLPKNKRVKINELEQRAKK